MDLSPDELRELAAFFAKRLTPDLRRVDPTEPPAPGDPIKAWVEVLQGAQDEGRLHRLARQIASRDRSDRALQEACQLLQPAGGRALGGVLLGSALVAALALGVIWAGAGPRAPTAPGADPQVQIHSAFQMEALEPLDAPDPVLEAPDLLADAPVPALDAPDPALDAPDPVLDAPEPLADASDSLADAPDLLAEVPEALPARSAPPPSADRADPTKAEGRCTAPDGGIVGYWYAGSEPPGEVGEVAHISHAVHVRADFPRRENDFDTRATVTCLLKAGDRVRISEPPVHVPRDAWWVPLRSGDLIASERPDGPLARR